MEEFSWQFIILAAILIFVARNSKNYAFYVKFVYCYLTLMFLGIALFPLMVVQFFMNKHSSNFYIYSKALCELSKYIIGIKWTIRGEENLQTSKAAIIVSNHQSGLDVIGMSYIRLLSGEISVISKRELLFSGPFGVAMYLSGCKFINRATREKAAEALRMHADEMKQKDTKLWIFAEGTRRCDGKIHKFKHGAFNAAIHAQLPIIPIVYSSLTNLIDYENKTFTRGEIIITILPEISTQGLKLDDVPSLMEKTRDTMIEVYNKTSMN